MSTILAGVKRNTGLAPKKDLFGPQPQEYFDKYLGAGEYIYDTSVGFMNASAYFERK